MCEWLINFFSFWMQISTKSLPEPVSTGNIASPIGPVGGPTWGFLHWLTLNPQLNSFRLLSCPERFQTCFIFSPVWPSRSCKGNLRCHSETFTSAIGSRQDAKSNISLWYQERDTSQLLSGRLFSVLLTQCNFLTLKGQFDVWSYKLSQSGDCWRPLGQPVGQPDGLVALL